MDTPTPPPFDYMALTWFKSTASSDNGACVEVAWAPADRVATRDSKDPYGPILLFTSAEWAAFVGSARAGEFNVPS